MTRTSGVSEIVGWIFSGGSSNVDGLIEKVEGVEYAPDNAKDDWGNGVANRENEVDANGDNGPGDAAGTDTGIETRLTLVHLKPRLEMTDGLDISPNPWGNSALLDQRTQRIVKDHTAWRAQREWRILGGA